MTENAIPNCCVSASSSCDSEPSSSLSFRAKLLRGTTYAVRLAGAAGLLLGSIAAGAQTILPQPESSGQTRVGRTTAESGTPEWPTSPQAPAGAPNVLVIITDDVGFGASSAFGGLIPTPALEALAARGIRYNQFNTTAICSPTRASLLTGREPHNVNVGNVNNFSQGYEGYTSVVPKSAGMIAETLRQHGYSTAAFGKWHLTPEWEQSAVGPFDRWPTSEGFNYFYGFHGGNTDQYTPSLIENTLPVAPPTNEPNYILDHDLANHAISWMQQQHELAPAKPFFVYYATGTPHSPHSAPKEWLAKFRGKFDQGWDVVREQIFARQKSLNIIPVNAKLTPRPSFLPAWSTLSAERKIVYARLMETYAATLAYNDHEIGRVIESLRTSGQFENTLIFYLEGDNGSSAEGGQQGFLIEDTFINGYPEDIKYILKHLDDIGGPKAQSHFPAPWAWAMDTPFQYYKQVASHFGGVRNGLVVSWPERVKDSATVRSQFLHVSDIAPTILEAVGVQQPTELNGVAQKPLDGIGFAYTFSHPKEPSHRHTQVFEMMQNLGIYRDGWWAGTRPGAAPWDITFDRKIDPASRTWELYDIDSDFSQSRDLAVSNPSKLAEMKNLFWAEAEKYHILPIHSIDDGVRGRPSLTAGRTVFTYHSGLTRVPENAAPRIIGRSYTITADIGVPAGGANGVMVTQGGQFGGYAFYLKEGRPVFHYNAIGEDHQYSIRAREPLTAGAHKLVADFAADSSTPGAGGTMTVSVDGNVVARGRIERTHRVWISLYEGFDVGEDTLSPINGDYTIKNSKFTGDLKQVTIELK